MKVFELLKFLQSMPYDAEVHLDDPEYPRVKGAYHSDALTVADPADAPPVGSVLLEVSYPKSDEN